MKVTKPYSVLMESLFALLLIVNFFSSSASAQDEAGFVDCLPPLKGYEVALLEEIEFHGETSTPKFGVVMPGFKVQCHKGSIELLVGESVSFHENGSVSALTVGSSTLLSQKQAELKVPAGAELRFSPSGLVTEAYGINVSSVLIDERTIAINKKVNFHESGDFSWGLLASGSKMEFEYFGNNYNSEESERLYMALSGNIFVEGMRSGLVGDWTLEQRFGNLKFSIDSNGEGEHQIFLLKGDPSMLKASIKKDLLRAINPMVKPFDLNQESEAKIEFHGLKEVPNPEGEGTIFEPILTAATMTLVDGQLEIRIQNGDRLRFFRDSWTQKVGNFIKTVFQASISLLILLITFLLALVGVRSFNSAVKNAKIDKRLKRNRGKSKAELYLLGPVLILVLGIAVHGLILDYFRIGGFFDYMSFFFY
jgi:hypothetical protein